MAQTHNLRARLSADGAIAVQKTLRDLKSKISSQSKKNFVLEKDVRYLDSRIALLIQNRMALEEVSGFHVSRELGISFSIEQLTPKGFGCSTPRGNQLPNELRKPPSSCFGGC